jgi:hypothetical protein
MLDKGFCLVITCDFMMSFTYNESYSLEKSGHSVCRNFFTDIFECRNTVMYNNLKR